jgi:hypothetical protein
MIIPQVVALGFVGIACWFALFGSWWAILFTGKYPQSLFNFIVWYWRWTTRVSAYSFLLTDKYPPFSGAAQIEYPAVFKVECPQRLSRLTSFFRLPLVPLPTKSGWGLEPQSIPGLPMAIPQYLALAFVSIAAVVILFCSWWAILFTARYPQSLFNFIIWWFRWSIRVEGYVYLLTDKYPPFSGEA